MGQKCCVEERRNGSPNGGGGLVLGRSGITSQVVEEWSSQELLAKLEDNGMPLLAQKFHNEGFSGENVALLAKLINGVPGSHFSDPALSHETLQLRLWLVRTFPKPAAARSPPPQPQRILRNNSFLDESDTAAPQQNGNREEVPPGKEASGPRRSPSLTQQPKPADEQDAPYLPPSGAATPREAEAGGSISLGMIHAPTEDDTARSAFPLATGTDRSSAPPSPGTAALLARLAALEEQNAQLRRRLGASSSAALLDPAGGERAERARWAGAGAHRARLALAARYVQACAPADPSADLARVLFVPREAFLAGGGGGGGGGGAQAAAGPAGAAAGAAAFPTYAELAARGAHVGPADLPPDAVTLYVSHRWWDAPGGARKEKDKEGGGGGGGGRRLVPDSEDGVHRALVGMFLESAAGQPVTHLWVDVCCLVEEEEEGEDGKEEGPAATLRRQQTANVGAALLLGSKVLALPRLRHHPGGSGGSGSSCGANNGSTANGGGASGAGRRASLPAFSDLTDYCGRAWCRAESALAVAGQSELWLGLVPGSLARAQFCLVRQGAAPGADLAPTLDLTLEEDGALLPPAPLRDQALELLRGEGGAAAAVGAGGGLLPRRPSLHLGRGEDALRARPFDAAVARFLAAAGAPQAAAANWAAAADPAGELLPLLVDLLADALEQDALLPAEAAPPPPPLAAGLARAHGLKRAGSNAAGGGALFPPPPTPGKGGGGGGAGEYGLSLRRSRSGAGVGLGPALAALAVPVFEGEGGALAVLGMALAAGLGAARAPGDRAAVVNLLARSGFFCWRRRFPGVQPRAPAEARALAAAAAVPLPPPPPPPPATPSSSEPAPGGAEGGQGGIFLDLSGQHLLCGDLVAVLEHAAALVAAPGGGGGGPEVRSLDLSGNKLLGLQGLEALAGPCRAATGALRSLDLAYCSVAQAGPAGARCLARLPALTALGLRGNCLFAAGPGWWGGLARLAGLVELDLGDNGLGLRQLGVWEAVGRLPALAALSLRDNAALVAEDPDADTLQQERLGWLALRRLPALAGGGGGGGGGRLDLHGCPLLGPGSWAGLAELVAGAPGLAELDVSASGLGKGAGVMLWGAVLEQAAAAVAAGEGEEGLRTLRASGNQLAGEEVDAAALQALLEANPPLRALELNGNKLNEAAAAALGAGLAENTVLQRLELHSNWLCEPGARALSATLGANTALHALNLRSNNLGPGGGRAVAEALRCNRALTALDLSFNNLGEEGGRAVAVALEGNPALAALNLSSNKIVRGAAAALGRLLHRNAALTALTLNHNLLGPAGAAAVAAGLARNGTLTALGLAANRLGDGGARAVAAALWPAAAGASPGPLGLGLGLGGGGGGAPEALLGGGPGRVGVGGVALSPLGPGWGRRPLGAPASALAVLDLRSNRLTEAFGQDAAALLRDDDPDRHSVGSAGSRGAEAGGGGGGGSGGGGAGPPPPPPPLVLERLDLGSNKLGAQGARALLGALGDRRAPLWLGLAANGVGEGVGAALGELEALKGGLLRVAL